MNSGLPRKQRPQDWRRRWAWPVGIMLCLTWISGTPGPQLGPMQFTGVDKVGHFCVFGALGVAFVRCWRESIPRSPLRSWSLAVLLTSLYGLADEWHQRFNPDRYFEWYDLLADTLGAMVLTGLYVGWGQLRQVLEWHPSGGRRLAAATDAASVGE